MMINNDPVNHPAHYTSGSIECIDAISAACYGTDGNEGFLVGQVIKYVWRFKHKGKPVEDLKKAQFYLNKLIDLEDSRTNVVNSSVVNSINGEWNKAKKDS